MTHDSMIVSSAFHPREHEGSVKGYYYYGPRSLSTSLMYSFAQRSDADVVDEPLYAHYLRVTGAARPYRDLVLSTQDNDGARVMHTLGKPRAPPLPSNPLDPPPGPPPPPPPPPPSRLLFCKHMAKHFTSLPYDLLLSRPGSVHVLLLRQPDAVIRSFSAVLPPSLEETALPALVAIFSALRAAGRAPFVLLSEDLQQAPEATLRALCGHIGAPFEPAMLSWSAGPRPEDGVWAPWWYATVHTSTGFMPASSSSSRGATPEPSAAGAGRAPPAPLAPRLQQLAEECQPFYNLLKQHAVRPPALAPPPPPAPPPLVLPSMPLPAPPHAAGAAEQPSSHSYEADARNDTVLVGIRDGVTGSFALHRRADAKVSVFDSGFILGDGVWEGIRIVAGCMVFAREHLNRLFEGAKAIDMDLGASRAEVAAMVYAVVDANGMRDGVHVRLMCTRGLKATPYQSPKATIGRPTIVVIAEWKAAAAPRRGLRLHTSHVRRGAADVQDPALNSHSKLNCITACISAIKAGADEALMLDPHGFVCTCNSVNFLVVRGGELWAPTTKYQLHGITRAAVLDVARAAGLVVRECDFSLTQVYSADEAMVTGTFAGVMAVEAVDGRVIGRGAVEICGSEPSVVGRLQALYKEKVQKEAARGREDHLGFF